MTFSPDHILHCQHRHDLPLFPQTLIYYSLSLSTFFVVALYAFVPPSIRRLPRDHVSHVQWRAGVVTGVSLVALGIYPLVFCIGNIEEGMEGLEGEDARISNNSDGGMDSFPPWYRYLGISWDISQAFKIVLHVMILYLGYFSCTWVRIYHWARMLDWKEKHPGTHMKPNDNAQFPTVPQPKFISQSFHLLWMEPTKQSLSQFRNDSTIRWLRLRNFLIAPLAEEIIFRACLLPPLLASQGGGMTPTKASWIAPLFFGVAHLHHFYEKLRHLHPSDRSMNLILQMLLGMVCQWGYTTLFGAYVSHVFVRTGSLLGVFWAHMFCNYMGLPDFSFGGKSSGLYDYRWFIGGVYLVGIGWFVLEFSGGSWVFPRVSVLPRLLSTSAV